MARVLARDCTADGQFVYGVRSTRVFCKPSCSSPQARPENIVIFDDSSAAVSAGFRACLRCGPSASPQLDNLRRIEEVAAYIREHADEPLPLKRLAKIAGLSSFHLQRLFTAQMGVSPKAFQSAARMALFKDRLKDGETVLGAMIDAGYTSTSRLHDAVSGRLGMTPTAYRAGGAGEVIVHATRNTILGPLLMAATERGVCFVQFGSSSWELERQLANEFPKAKLKSASAHAAEPLDAWIAALNDYLAGLSAPPVLPLDLRGTAFQIRVWQFLLSVKSGDVVTYSEIASGIGAPKAIRAAASACGANRIGILIPCHRAVRADGGLGGFRWGIERKRALLDQERLECAVPGL